MPNRSKALSIPFSQVIGESDRLSAHYYEYEQEFAEYKPLKYTDAYKSSLAERIAQAHKTLAYHDMLGTQDTEKAKRQALIKEFYVAYDRLLNYLSELKQIESEAIKSEFGFGHKTEIKLNARTVLHFLDTLPAKFEKYNSELSAIGLPDSIKLNLATLRSKLLSQIMAHNLAIDSSLSATPERLKLFHSIWDDLVSMEWDAKTIFSDRPSIALLFKLDKSSHTKHSTLNTTVSETSVTTTTTITKIPKAKPVKPPKPSPTISTSTTTTTSSTTSAPAVSPPTSI